MNKGKLTGRCNTNLLTMLQYERQDVYDNFLTNMGTGETNGGQY